MTGYQESAQAAGRRLARTGRRRSKRGRVPKREWDESLASAKVFGDGSTPTSRANMVRLAELTLMKAGHSWDPAATYTIDVKRRTVERAYKA